MRITRVRLQNLKSFEDSDWIDLGRVSIFAGPNNSGKSTILRAIHHVQDGSPPVGQDVRIGARSAQVRYVVDVLDPAFIASGEDLHLQPALADGTYALRARITSDSSIPPLDLLIDLDGTRAPNRTVPRFESREPRNLIYPYLANRKVGGYNETVNSETTGVVRGDLQNLVSKVNRLASATHPSHARYRRACEDLLGFVPTGVPSRNGLKTGIAVGRFDTIAVDAMGDGVPQMLGLICDLVMAEGQTFLIEEPENDLHPGALKRLLQLMLESGGNSFVVSTHSPLVVQYLGSVSDARVYLVDQDRTSTTPLSTIREIGPSPQERLDLLRALGVSPADMHLDDGWLILEESTAERVIKELLVPWFAPRCARIATLSAAGVDNVEPYFQAFDKLVRFAHLSAYRERTWVMVDGDTHGKAVCDRLRTTYATWSPERFGTWSAPAFEHFYPAEFTTRVNEALAIADGKQRQTAKQALFHDVMEWARSDDEHARKSFEASAAEVVAFLKTIDAHLAGLHTHTG